MERGWDVVKKLYQKRSYYRSLHHLEVWEKQEDDDLQELVDKHPAIAFLVPVEEGEMIVAHRKPKMLKFFGGMNLGAHMVEVKQGTNEEQLYHLIAIKNVDDEDFELFLQANDGHFLFAIFCAHNSRAKVAYIFKRSE